MPARDATTTTSGSSAATAPLMLMSADVGDEDADHDEERHPLRARPGDHLVTCPGGDAGGIERLAHHEERRDEDDRRVAEAREGLLQRQDAGEEQRERDADGDDAEREAIAHEGDDREREDHERYDDGVHGVSVAAGRASPG